MKDSSDMKRAWRNLIYFVSIIFLVLWVDWSVKNDGFWSKYGIIVWVGCIIFIAVLLLVMALIATVIYFKDKNEERRSNNE